MSLFAKNPNQKIPPRIRAGSPCQHCPHSHLDHSMYSPQHCLIEGCTCSGLKLDIKPILPNP
jgi:hypothetical protein